FRARSIEMGSSWLHLVAPRKSPLLRGKRTAGSGRPSSRDLPLELCREPSSRKTAKRLRLEPVDVKDGQVGLEIAPLCEAPPFPTFIAIAPPVHGMRSAFAHSPRPAVFTPTRPRLVPSRIDERRKLRLSNGRARDRKRRDLPLVAPFFVVEDE